MTRRDFQALAIGLYEARISPRERQKLANIIASICAKHNQAFNSTKFYEAAGCNKHPALEEK